MSQSGVPRWDREEAGTGKPAVSSKGITRKLRSACSTVKRGNRSGDLSLVIVHPTARPTIMPKVRLPGNDGAARIMALGSRKPAPAWSMHRTTQSIWHFSSTKGLFAGEGVDTGFERPSCSGRSFPGPATPGVALGRRSENRCSQSNTSRRRRRLRRLRLAWPRSRFS